MRTAIVKRLWRLSAWLDDLAERIYGRPEPYSIELLTERQREYNAAWREIVHSDEAKQRRVALDSTPFLPELEQRTGRSAAPE